LYGSVRKRNYAWKEGEEPFKPLASTTVVVEGPAGLVAAQTDGRGDFRFTNLAPGDYKVRLKVPKGLTTYEMSQDSYAVRKASVVERGCARIDFHLEADTRVAGRVLDAEGKPLTDAAVQMRGAPGSRSSGVNSTRTDAEGRFEFKDMTPGDYLLGIRIYNAPFGIVPYPRTFYPGVPTEAQAAVLVVKEGDQLRDLELRLPARLNEYEVEGAVVWSDGRPAPGANLYLSLQEGGATTAFVMLKADERGRFKLKVCEGLSFTVNAYTDGAGDAMAARSPQVEVPPRGSAPLKLVLAVTKK
ncbi:MAG: carboxypeptidase-like regulatory domain-containing protein, partial [Acidobacteria bacterium]|nr:carboxypeptidase-like regulatory domain-containing protein [Acidobacteriota bacterium]